LFGKDHAQEHNEEVIRASTLLHEKCIPQCADELKRMNEEIEPQKLVEIIHKNGINLR
jgi:hypothetical protein